MAKVKRFVITFSATNISKGYKDKVFAFDSDSEAGLWRVIRKFKDNGNDFSLVSVSVSNQYGRVDSSFLELPILVDLNKMSFEFFAIKYDIPLI